MTIPTARDSAALEWLAHDSDRLEPNLNTSDTFGAALRELLEVLAQGKAMTVLAMDAELSSVELADLLGVSRPSAVAIFERGLTPYRTVGTHRHVRLEDAR